MPACRNTVTSARRSNYADDVYDIIADITNQLIKKITTYKIDQWCTIHA